MTKPQETSPYVVSSSVWLSRMYYFTQLLGILFAIGLAVLLGPKLLVFVHPRINILFLSLGVLFILMACFSFFIDTQEMLGRWGLDFTEEYLYLYRIMGKIKFPYSEIRQVIVYPALLNLSSGASGKRAWVQIKIGKRNYVLVVPRSPQAMEEFQARGISVKTNTSLIPILSSVFMLSLFLIRGALFGLICIGLMLSGFFSKNGYWSRRSEILLLLAALAIPLTVASLFPWSKADAKVAMIAKYQVSSQFEEEARVCSQVSPEENAEILNQCAWFYTTAKSLPMRNYQRGYQLASQAVESGTDDKHVAMYADTLACAYMGMGRIDYALQVAKDYELSARLSEFSMGKLCSP